MRGGGDQPGQEPESVSAGGGALQEEADFNFTYKASRHEQQWLSQALGGFTGQP